MSPRCVLMVTINEDINVVQCTISIQASYPGDCLSLACEDFLVVPLDWTPSFYQSNIRTDVTAPEILLEREAPVSFDQ